MDSGNSNGGLPSSSGDDDDDDDQHLYDDDSSCCLFPSSSFHFNPPLPPSLINVSSSSSHQQPTHFPSTHFLNLQPDPIHHHPPPNNNPKKRTRASRRAPTTVLTTHTSNFRQMVQEFTGIPTAPFSSSPHFHLFSSIRSAASLRPSLLKPAQPSHLLQDNNYNSQSLLNLQTPSPLLSTFHHSLLPFNQPTMEEELGLAAATARGGEWRSGEGDQHHGFRNMMTYGAAANSQRASSCKTKYNSAVAGASSDQFLQHDKGLENVVISRGEGTVETWISPSDQLTSIN